MDELCYYDSEDMDKGRETFMCKAFDDHYKSGKKEGLKHGIFSMIRDNMELGVNVKEIVKKLQRYFGIGEEQSMEYIEQYPQYDFELAKMS